MEIKRKPFQGVLNIMRFNWHFYVLALTVLNILIQLNKYVTSHYLLLVLFYLILFTVIISLVVSYYVYDVSKIYSFNWLVDNDEKIEIVNIHAGFDETSVILQSKFKNANLTILDFYDPKLHTEISIERARKAYPAQVNTIEVSTLSLTLKNNSVDKVFVIFSAHEIRNNQERVVFFTEIYRVLKPNGQVYITEHLRDFTNFFAYTFGFFHFLSEKSWHKTFKESNFKIKSAKKFTPFVTNFILEKNGTTT